MITKKQIKELNNLEGNEVKWGDSVVEYTGVFNLFNYSIGLSISNKEDERDYLTCFHGPDYHATKSNYDKRDYDAILLSALAMIKKSYFNPAEVEKYYAEPPSQLTWGSPTCPFNP